jgi:hypothetical protein
MSERSDLRLARQQMRHDRRRRGMSRWVWWLVIAFPLLFLMAGAGMVFEAIVFVSQAESTQGRVIQVERSHDSEGGVSYTPLILYESGEGLYYEGETHISSGNYDYDIGDRVEILYSYADPETVRINSFFSLYGIGLIFAAMGGLFVLVLMAVRRKMFGQREGGSVLAQMEREAAEKWRRENATAGEATRKPGPVTTDTSRYGHVHKPKPKHEPTVRRMR